MAEKEAARNVNILANTFPLRCTASKGCRMSGGPLSDRPIATLRS